MKKPRVPKNLKARTGAEWADEIAKLEAEDLRCAVASVVQWDFWPDEALLGWVDRYYDEQATYVPDAEVQAALVAIGYTAEMAAWKFSKATVLAGPPKRSRQHAWTIGDKVVKRAKHWSKADRKVRCA